MLIMHPNYAVIHCQPSLADYLTKNAFTWSYSKQHGYDEIDVLVDDIPYEVVKGFYQDPDAQLLEHYGIDPDYVNWIEPGVNPDPPEEDDDDEEDED